MTTPRQPYISGPTEGRTAVPGSANVVSRGANGGDIWPRYANAIIAVWLFISAFAWPHTHALRNDTWIVAVVMFCVALASIGNARLRFINTVAAVWLFFSTIGMASMTPGTVWNNIIVAIVVFVLSLMPTGTDSRLRSHPAHT